MVCNSYDKLEISIHALREESDLSFCVYGISGQGFQSTPSARRATAYITTSKTQQQYFNPRPPRGERLTSCLPYPQRGLISIHALREESDPTRRFEACA